MAAGARTPRLAPRPDAPAWSGRTRPSRRARSAAGDDRLHILDHHHGELGADLPPRRLRADMHLAHVAGDGKLDHHARGATPCGRHPWVVLLSPAHAMSLDQ